MMHSTPVRMMVSLRTWIKISTLITLMTLTLTDLMENEGDDFGTRMMREIPMKKKFRFQCMPQRCKTARL